MADLVTIASGELTARINALGAELWSLTDRAGRELMTDADPAFWTGHAPLLFPIVGELAGGTYRLDEREYTLQRHGFARRSHFGLVAAHAQEARFRLGDSAETRAVYPFAFALEMAFRLERATLAITATVVNGGEEPLPFSIGFHPGFAWPLPFGGAKEDHAIMFDDAEPQDIRRLDRDGLVARSEPTPIDGRCLALRGELFEEDAIVWDRLASRAVTYGAPGAPRLRIAFPDAEYLGVWQKPGARYICIEPWNGIADPAGFSGDLREKPGVMLLAPGASRSFRMDVTLLRD